MMGYKSRMDKKGQGLGRMVSPAIAALVIGAGLGSYSSGFDYKKEIGGYKSQITGYAKDGISDAILPGLKNKSQDKRLDVVPDRDITYSMIRQLQIAQENVDKRQDAENAERHNDTIKAIQKALEAAINVDKSQNTKIKALQEAFNAVSNVNNSQNANIRVAQKISIDAFYIARGNNIKFQQLRDSIGKSYLTTDEADKKYARFDHTHPEYAPKKHK